MITHHGYKTIPTSKVKAPGDIEKIRRERHTLELAESLATTGGKPADPIILEWGTWKLLGGRHRFAAALNAKLKEVDALLLEGTPEELEAACLVEQVKRRQATDVEVARLVELLHPTPEQTFPDVEEDEEPEPARKPGRPSTGKKEALTKVAAITGRTKAAVKQADYRARHEDDEPEDEVPSCCIDTMGLKVQSDVQADAWSEFQFLEGIEKTLVKLQGDCKRHVAVGNNEYPQLKGIIHDAASLARALMPKSVCPHCKLTSLRKGCLACRGRGWLREREMANVPADLLVTGPMAGVFVKNKLCLLHEVK